MLVGDRDRELAASALRRHFVEGRLSTDELSDRLDVALHARSRGQLTKATVGLPPVWEDLPAGIFAAGRRVRRGMRRARFFFALVRAWVKVNLVLLLALGVALVVGAPVALSLGAAVAAWALAGFAFWRFWRRGPV